jgi:hypothetical protein
MNPFDKHKFAEQPVYHKKPAKIKARDQLVEAYRQITGEYSIPENKSYWTLCNKQPDTDGAEINQMVKKGLLVKKQFFGVDNDLKNEGVIDFNKNCHPEANWLLGDWLNVIEENYDIFNPACIYFDYTKTVVKPSTHFYLAKTMNLCPPKTFVAANLMLSDGHSSKRFEPKILVESILKYLRNKKEWTFLNNFYQYKSSRTEMGMIVFVKQ